MLGIGVLCLLIAFLSLFTAMFSHAGPPRLFFLGFIGIPLIFVGGVMTASGYKRVIADYAASELSPVASGTVNYLGETTQPGVRAFGEALRDGGRDEAATMRHCTQCGVRLASGARFCQACGVALAGDE